MTESKSLSKIPVDVKRPKIKRVFFYFFPSPASDSAFKKMLNTMYL